MSQSELLKITVTTNADGEVPVQLVLERLFGVTAAVYIDERTKASQVSVFCSQAKDWSAERRRVLSREIGRLKSNEDNSLGSGRISIKRLPPENWAESWKRHFKPMEVGSMLLVKPSWSHQKPRKGQKVIVLDPGLSFGTGQHPTTSYCLRQLVSCHKPRTKRSFLDMGTGSGILAIAAAKLGYAPVVAFDFDPEAVRVAQSNARKNRVRDRIVITRADLTKMPLRSVRRFDFICANLISTLLLAEKKRIVNRLNPRGVLVVAGILRDEFTKVQAAFEQLGLKYSGGRSEKEWRSGVFVAQ